MKYYTWSHNIDGCLRNGSFVRTAVKECSEGKYVQYMNGDFMGYIQEVPEGMVEVDHDKAIKLLPKVCGGKGVSNAI